MARYITQELLRTVRERPIRAAFAALLLLATTIYVCSDHSGIRVAEIGEETTPVIDLTDSLADHEFEIQQASADDSDDLATTTRVDGHDRFEDPHVVTAVAELSDKEKSQLHRVQPVSGQTQRTRRDSKPVWLLGRLIED